MYKMKWGCSPADLWLSPTFADIQTHLVLCPLTAVHTEVENIINHISAFKPVKNYSQNILIPFFIQDIWVFIYTLLLR